MLEKMGIFDYKDVLMHLPRRYEDYSLSSRETLLHMQNKQRVVLRGKVVGRVELFRFKGVSQIRFAFASSTGLEFRIIAWNQPYLTTYLDESSDYTIQASYDASRHCMNALAIKKGTLSSEESIVPVYSLPLDYPQHHFRDLVKKAFEQCGDEISDDIPEIYRTKYRLLPKLDALKKCHFPKCQEDVYQGMRVLKYEEVLLFSLKNQLIRKKNKALSRNYSRKFDHKKLSDFVYSLPYKLTKSQNEACREIVVDMERPTLMNRLLQGDVGTGKTMVAGIAMFANYLRSMQSAFMAPTDALARQHYNFFLSFFEKTPIKVGLLVGAMSSGERREVLEALSAGSIDVIVGTHALFSKDVEFDHLGFVVIDEQHKFGVNQRASLASKGDEADLLLMSATPIPRTLSMTLYGDMDVSSLHDFPFGKRDVETLLVKSNSKKIPSLIQQALTNSKRVFIVTPQIEESENEFASAKRVYDSFFKLYGQKVTLLHGKMNFEEKEAALLSFQTGLCPILVSTSVIEVGIDIKNASLMIVYEASHFALSSLHQLRGRVGRDGSKATFVMVYDEDDEETKQKLSVLLSTEDGFEIAEADLRLRGPGTIAGVRQSGLPDFLYANLIHDFKMFELAREDAAYIVEHSSEAQFKKTINKALIEAKIALIA